MATATLEVSGMTCNHCVHAVKRALEDIEGVEEAKVDLQAGKARVDFDASRTTAAALADAVTEEGYPARPA